MTYATAKAKVVALFESAAATPTTKKLGFGSKFVFDPTAGQQQLPSARHFWIRTASGSIKGPLTKQTRRRMADVEAFFFYPDAVDQNELDLVMQSDFKALSDVVVDPDLYDVANSGLVAVSQGTPFIVPYQVQEVAEGHLLVLRFPMEYKE